MATENRRMRPYWLLTQRQRRDITTEVAEGDGLNLHEPAKDS